MPDATPPAVQVWWLDPRHLPPQAAGMLSVDERMRLDARSDPRDALRRAAANVLLRCAVGLVVGQEPREVTVSRDCPHCPAPHGRPELPDLPLQVSVSHAGNRAAVALCAGGAVGVDVEGPRTRAPSSALVRRSLTAAEVRHLLGMPESRRRSEFLRAWTAKEAILKATGQGLHGGPEKLELDLTSRPVGLRSWSGSTARASRVRLVELSPGDDHIATLATIGGEAGAASSHDGRTLVERMSS